MALSTELTKYNRTDDQLVECYFTGVSSTIKSIDMLMHKLDAIFCDHLPHL